METLRGKEKENLMQTFDLATQISTNLGDHRKNIQRGKNPTNVQSLFSQTAHLSSSATYNRQDTTTI